MLEVSSLHVIEIPKRVFTAGLACEREGDACCRYLCVYILSEPEVYVAGDTHTRSKVNETYKNTSAM